MVLDEYYFPPADDEHIKREKAKARELRKSQWWKNRLGEGKCAYCGKEVHPKYLTMDHIVPVVRGGRTRRSNVVTCCRDCNSRKKHMLPVEWQDYLDELRRRSREC